jgi:hypothetical protein
MTYWKATVEKPDGTGGWQLVAVFGTDAYPHGGTGQYLHGDTPLDAAKLLLSHVWPIDLREPGRYDNNPNRWREDQAASTGIADHRITIEPGERKWDAPFGAERPEPLVVTVAEMQLAQIRHLAAEAVAARTKADELTGQARAARLDAQHALWRIEQAREGAVRAGVDPGELTKAKRMPRRPKKKS